MKHIKVSVNSLKEYLKLPEQINEITISIFSNYVATALNIPIVGMANVKLYDNDGFAIRNDDCLRDVLKHANVNFYLDVSFDQKGTTSGLNQIITSEVK